MTCRSSENMVKSFDRIADRFDETRSYPEEVMGRVVDAVAAAMEPGSAVLDAGTGTGRFALPLRERSFEVVGVDVSRKMLAKAASKGLHDLLVSNVCALPFRDLSFDHALSVHLIHLIPEWRSALKEIGRVTKGSLVTVVSDRERSDVEEMRRLYSRTCTKLGFEVKNAGPMERELPDLLAPDASVFVTTQERPVDVGNILDNYETRTFSEQWEVPDDVHHDAVRLLRDTYGKVDAMVSREDISVLVWRAERIRAIGRRLS